MLKSYKELTTSGYSQDKINVAVEAKELFKIEKGIYSDKETYQDEELICFKYPNAVITLESALAIYDDSYPKPEKIEISTPHKSKQLKNDLIKQYFNTSPGYESGVEDYNYKGSIIKIYNVDKLLVEFIRHKSSYTDEEFNNILKYFINNKSKLNKEKIYNYIEDYKYQDKITEVLENKIFNKKFKEAKNMRGIVLAGGSGTRLYPITKGISKQLVPVYDKPMVYYPISVLMLAGIRDILIITTPEDQENFKRALGDGSQFGVNFEYVVQPSPDGLAQAFLLGENFIGNNSCALALGDNIFYGNGFVKMLENAVMNCQNGLATNFGIHVHDPERFGVMEVEKKGDGKFKILSIEEKPKEPKSNFAVTGLYFYPNDVVAKAKEVKPSDRGELEITSLNNIYLEDNRLLGELLGGGFNWYDTGTFDSLLDAASSIKSIEINSGRVVACLEQIAYDNGWINDEQLAKRVRTLGTKNSYGKYLNDILKRGR